MESGRIALGTRKRGGLSVQPSTVLAGLGLSLPEVAKPLAAYSPAIQVGQLIFTSGQLPFGPDGSLVTGKVGGQVTLDQGRLAAQLACLNALAASAQLAGGLDQIERIVKLTVFVNGAHGFTDQPLVANGASHLLQALFGERGQHARSALGVAELPLGAAVELELVVQVKD